MKKYRIEKVQELIRREITQIIQKELKDPRIQGFINVNEVKISRDLKIAQTYISIFGIEDKKVDEVFKGLINASGFIKYKLSKILRLRVIPDINFVQDRSVEKGIKIINRLEKLKEEREKCYVSE